MNYAFEHDGKIFTPTTIPDVAAQITNVGEYNLKQEQAEIAWLKTAPDRVFLYVRHQDVAGEGRYYDVGTWLGTKIGTHVSMGPRRNIGFGWHTYRRAVTCRIFGVLYHGWYFESSGSYCRLRKAKRQD